jgi:predicted metalloenzyme YecM
MSDLMLIVNEIENLLNQLSIEEKRFVINHLNLKLKLEENDERKEKTSG